MAPRIFAVLSAVFLVLAVGVAALTPMGLTLGQGLLMYSPKTLDWMRLNSATWLMNWVELPFLLRPLWLLPASIGVVLAGLAATFNLGKTSTSRRRRS